MEDARGLAAGKVDSALLAVHKLAEGSAGGGEQPATAGGMLHHAACSFDGSGIALPDVGHLPGEEERTHVKDLQESPPAAAGVLAPCKGKPADVESVSKGRHELGRPGFLADGGGGGVLVAGEAEAPAAAEEEAEEDCGRERLKRHRVAMAGRVWIPESWGQEELLKDWSDCAAIDRSLVPTGLLSAREALVEECRRANSGRFGRLENGRCLST